MINVKFRLVRWYRPDDANQNDVLTFGPSDKPLAEGAAPTPDSLFSVSVTKAESAGYELERDYVFSSAPAA